METYILFWFILALTVGFIGKNRKIGFGMAFLWSLILSPFIGLIIVLLSKACNSYDENNKYNFYLEEGKKFEYKKNINAAIDSYMDALYHLENDYKKLQANDESKRQKLILQIKGKVERLNQI